MYLEVGDSKYFHKTIDSNENVTITICITIVSK